MERSVQPDRLKGLETFPNLRSQDFRENKLEDWLNQIRRPPEVREIRLKILQNLNYVPPDELDMELDRLNYSNFPKKPYAVVFDHKIGKSKRWIYNYIKYDLPSAPAFGHYPNPEMLQRNFSKIEEKGVSDFVCFDDASYSAAQIRLKFLHIILECAKTGVSRPNFYFYIPFMTDASITMINSLQDSYAAGRVKPRVFIERRERILSMKDLLTKKEQTIMARVHKSYGTDIYLNSSLTYFDHRRPDIQAFEFSLGEIMTKADPPYKKDKYLKSETDSYRRMLQGADF